ncbi:MAG TPA: RibD family protein [Gemmatimonadaceae bacterium]|nr:RibD family protein [Gemmatimonadaceae bacterium]
MSGETFVPGSRRPRVICHMMASVDGRIATKGWSISDEQQALYEEIHDQFDANAWMCGRVTMAMHFAQGVRSEDDVANEHTGGPRADFAAPGEHESYAFALDAHGRLVWESGVVDGDHVVAILSERVHDEYLAQLRAAGVSYLIAGRREIDLALALQKIAARFDVTTLMLEGGGHINGSMLRAGLIDEVSVLLAPVVDGRTGTPALFDEHEGLPRGLTLAEATPLRHDVLWLRYRVAQP